MSQKDKQGEINRLLGEKQHLKAEEEALRKIIETVKKQVSALQVEQLEIRNRVPLSRLSPAFFLGEPEKEKEQEEGEAELDLNLLQKIHSGTFAVEQEEVESD